MIRPRHSYINHLLQPPTSSSVPVCDQSHPLLHQLPPLLCYQCPTGVVAVVGVDVTDMATDVISGMAEIQIGGLFNERTV